MRTTPRDASNPRIVTGQINGSTGTLMNGTPGLIGARIGVGNYQVRFVPPFKATPNVVASPRWSTNVGAGVSSVDQTQMTVSTFLANTGAANDLNFEFTAIGPA